MTKLIPFLSAAALVSFVSSTAAADRSTKSSITIAAAANLVYALDALNAGFRRAEPGVVVTSTTGASGNLFAQIKNGAPFDIFLSADVDYPRQIVVAGLG